jgi:hypothetical protein
MVASDINDRPREIHNWKKPSRYSPNSSSHMLRLAESAVSFLRMDVVTAPPCWFCRYLPPLVVSGWKVNRPGRASSASWANAAARVVRPRREREANQEQRRRRK